MKWALALILSVLLAQPNWAVVALVSGAHTVKATSDTNNVTSDAITTTGSNFLVAAVSYYTPGTFTSFVDSKSNSWTALTLYTSAANGIKLFYSINPTVGTGHTFTVNGSGIYESVAIQGFSGVATAGFDAQNGANALSTTIQPGNVAPALDGELLVTAFSDAGGGVMSIDSGFTVTDQVPLASSVNFGVALAYIIKGTGTLGVNVNPTWTDTVGATCAATLAAFKAAPPASFGTINNPVPGGF